nr:hypothetical protein [Tanacetum cinerariifolium]
MRNKPSIDNLDIDDLYNNLKVYEADIKGSSRSSLNSPNVAFVSAESTSSTNELNAAYSASTAIGHSSQAEDLEQIDQDDLEEMDLKWQVAMLSMRVKRFYKKTRRKLEYNGKESVGFNKTKVECFNCHKRRHFVRDSRTVRNPGNRGRDAGNVGYRGRDNGKRRAREEDEKHCAKVKTGQGYDSHFNEKEVLDVKEEEVTETVFDNHSSDEENSLANDTFKKGEGFHAVPPPLTGNYMLPKLDLSFDGLDDFIYKFRISETVTSLSKDVKDTLETSIAFVEKPKEGTGQKKSRPVWNNVQGINHQNKFAPTAVFTRSRRIPVSATKPKAAASTSAAKPVNTARPKKISAVKGNRVTAVKALAGCV